MTDILDKVADLSIAPLTNTPLDATATTFEIADLAGDITRFADPLALGYYAWVWNRTDFPNVGDADRNGQAERVRVTARNVGPQTLTVVRDAGSPIPLNAAGKTYWLVASMNAQIVEDIDDRLFDLVAGEFTTGKVVNAPQLDLTAVSPGVSPLRFFEDTANGTEDVTLQAPAALAASIVVTLPSVLPGGLEFVTLDAAGLLATAASVSNTLDAAYDSGGAGAGRSITADNGAVEITTPAASGNAALSLIQADTQNALTITQSGITAGAALDIISNAAGIGLRVTQNAIADAIQIIQTQNDNGLFIQKSGVGGGDAFLVQNLGTSPAIRIDQDGVGLGLDIDIAAVSTLAGLRMINAGTGPGFSLTQSGAANAFNIVKNGIGKSLFIDDNTTGNALEIDKIGAGNSLTIVHGSSTTAIKVTNNSTGLTLEILGIAGVGIDTRSTTNKALAALVTSAGNSCATFRTSSASNSSPCVDIDNDGLGQGLNIASAATGNALINLSPVTGNTRGDIAFGTARTAAPSTPSEGDLWFETGLDRISARVTAAVGTQTVVSRYGPDFGQRGGASIVAGAVGANNGHLELNAETGVTDDLDNLTVPAHAKIGDTILLVAAAGDTITVRHNVGNIHLDASANKVLVNGNHFVVIYNGTDWEQLTTMMVLP